MSASNPKWTFMATGAVRSPTTHVQRMPPPIEYDELDLKRVDDLLATHGAVRLALNARRAAPLVSLMSLVRDSRGWRNRPFPSRVGRFSSGLVLTARIAIWQPRLLSLLNIIALHAPSQIWHQRSDGSVLFQFTRPARS